MDLQVIVCVAMIIVMAWRWYIKPYLAERKQKISASSTKAVVSGPGPRPMFNRAGREVMKKYNTIPIAHRPAVDLTSVLKALEVKYPDFDADTHYGIRKVPGYEQTRFSIISCNCGYNTACRFPEYRELYFSFQGILDSLAKRERAEKAYEQRLRVQNVEHDLNMIETVVASARLEAKAIKEITKGCYQ